MYLGKYINVYDNFLPLQTISTFIQFANKIKSFEKGQVGAGHIPSDRVNENIRKVTLHSLSNTDKSLSEAHWSNFLKYKFLKYFTDYLIEQNIPKDHLSFFEINQLDILKYAAGDYYIYHVDGGVNVNRSVSGVLFLNNDYEGGELCFKNTFNNEEFCIKPFPGRLVVWPSNFLFPHAVKPIKKGIRYSVVAWA